MKLFVGTKGLVVRPDGKVLIVRESSAYEDGTEEGKWDVVGGRIEPNETVFEGLVREVKEESGLSVTPGKLLGVFDGFPNIRGEACHVVRLYFACTAESDTVVLSQDHDAYEWIDPARYEPKHFADDIEEMLVVIAKKP